MFSKSCEYGLRAVIFIAQQSLDGNKVNKTTISKEINSPEAFTAKILQLLTKNQIVKSIKGPNGGFIIEENKLNTKLSEVVSILDGNSIYTGCALGLKQCDEKSPCPLHFKFVEIRNMLQKMLEENTLKNIITDLKLQKLILKR